MTSTSTELPAATIRNVPAKAAGRSRSPSPPRRPVPPSGAFSLSRTKCTLRVSSRTPLARASRSDADSSDPPPHATSPGPLSRTTASSVPTRRNMTTSRRPVDLPARRDSSAPPGSAAGADPCADLRRELRLILERKVLEGRREVGQPGLLGHDDPEAALDGDLVLGTEDDLDGVPGPDVPGLEDPQVGAGRAVGGEPLDEVR